jgi:Ca2+/H+ antiporter, TMEM165/GDT1 family
VRVDLTLLGMAFGIVFLAELPDKSALVSLVMATRYRPGVVFIGVAAAFAVQVIIAVAAGSLLSLAPRRVVDGLVAVLFLAGAALMLHRAAAVREDQHTSATAEESVPPGQAGNQRVTTEAGFWKAATTSFGILFVAEFGDLTQITIANLAATYHDPLAVGIGALLGLWTVAGLAVLGGQQLLRWIPLVWIARAAALVLTVLGVLSAAHAIAG